MDTLINFSGGVDSTYVAWDWLKNNPGRKALLHHVNLKSPEAFRRHKKEKKAVQDILKWFNQNSLANYEYLESTFDYKSFRYNEKDVTIVMFITGVLLKNPKRNSITKIIMPNNADDFSRWDYTDQSLPRFRVLKEMVPRNIEFLFPIRELKKPELAGAMPRDLFKLTWYCRRPTPQYKECGSCNPCKEVKQKLRR